MALAISVYCDCKMVIFEELKALIGYTSNDLDIVFIIFSLVFLLYLINIIFGMIGNIFNWR